MKGTMGLWNGKALYLGTCALALAAFAGFSSAPLHAQQPASTAAAPTAADPDDDADWDYARQGGSYEAYHNYALAHPEGKHLAEARKAVLTKVQKAEPKIGMLPEGETALVDDHSCRKDQIKVIIGGNALKGITRVKKCVAIADLP